MSRAEVIARAVWGKDIGAGTADDVVSCGVPNWQLCLPDAAAILAALDAAGLAVVPVEPTEEMVWHGASSHDHPNVFMSGPSHMGRRMAERIYRAMIASAKEDKTND
jgi:hypothetical protein